MARFRLQDVRLAFPNLFVASAPKGGGEKAFSASFLLPPNHPQLKALKDAMKAVATEKWGQKGAAIYAALEAQNKLALHDGNTKSEYEGFEGMLFVSSRSKIKPTVFDQQKNDVSQESGLIYSGCYVNASIELWAQANDFGKRINAQLRGVQFLRKGDAFAGGGSAADADEFDEISAPAEDASEDVSDEDLTA